MSVMPENTSTLPPTGEEHPAATTKTLEGEATLYKPVLAATRDLSHRFPREHISKALARIPAYSESGIAWRFSLSCYIATSRFR
jgi:hypothetical protein